MTGVLNSRNHFCMDSRRQHPEDEEVRRALAALAAVRSLTKQD
jgi:hypothetical protein